jgi:hypothetical protein
MTTGFIDRYKGKIATPIGGMYVGGVQVNASGPDSNTAVGWGTVSTYSSTQTLPNGGVVQILSTAIAVYNLSSPSPGRVVVIAAMPGSTAWMVKVSTGAVVILGGSTVTHSASTLANTIKSTSNLVATQVELIGLSTSVYLYNGVSPSSQAILFSTTT